MRFETKLIHAGTPTPRHEGAVVTPIYQSAMFEYAGEEEYHDLKYIRLNNTPNHRELHAKLAALEGAEDALVTGSGMAAISASLLAVLQGGDHFLAQDCLYGGTHDLITKDLPGLGIEHDLVDGTDPAAWEAKLRTNTKALYLETLSNPLLGLSDVKAAVEFARANGLVTLIDNTFPSPCNFRPAEWGIDLSLHSCTKYLNGHSDIVAGAVIGSVELVREVRHKLNHFGGSLDPHACFLLCRGMKTLAVRMHHQNEAGLTLARALEANPAVSNVNYPGLESHPQHAMARELLDGMGGMLSFELKGGLGAALRMMERLKLPINAPSLGGVESLVTRPVTTSHAGLSKAACEESGISDSLVRVSVGLEAAEDLTEDFAQALS